MCDVRQCCCGGGTQLIHSPSFVLNDPMKLFQSFIADWVYYFTSWHKISRKQRLLFCRWNSPLWAFWHLGSWYASIVLTASCFVVCNGTPWSSSQWQWLDEVVLLSYVMVQTLLGWKTAFTVLANSSLTSKDQALPLSSCSNCHPALNSQISPYTEISCLLF